MVVRGGEEIRRRQAEFVSDHPYDTAFVGQQTAHVMHRDGWHDRIMKVLIYPFGASQELGTTEFETSPSVVESVAGPAGCYAIFPNSTMNHRAISSKGMAERPAIQLSFLISGVGRRATTFTSHCANFPIAPSVIGLADSDAQRQLKEELASLMTLSRAAKTPGGV